MDNVYINCVCVFCREPLKKIGTKGNPISIGSNYIPISCKNEAVFQYHVTFVWVFIVLEKVLKHWVTIESFLLDRKFLAPFKISFLFL